MKITRILFSISCLWLLATLAVAQNPDQLVFADFETMKEKRVVSNGGGQIMLISYQERPTMVSRFKGQEGANPPAPEVVRLKKDDPNHAITFGYEFQAPNQYAGVGVEIQAQADKDGKPVALDLIAYTTLMVQLYVTGVQTVRAELITRGQGLSISGGGPQMTFKVKPGFNTYQLPLKSFGQPPWVEQRVSSKDVLKKLTAVSLTAYCDQCTLMTGTVVIDNVVFQK